MASDLWKPGDVVVWRDTWRGQIFGLSPLRVVADGPAATALYLAEGTSFTFHGWPWGEHPYDGKRWTGHGVLILHRHGTAHAIWHFWRGEERRFAAWYVNLQAPFVRDGHAFDSHDHELDLVVRPDGSWQWKDEEALQDWVRRGRFTEEEVTEIRAEGERVLAEWPFPTGWEEWEPDPSWPVPELRDDWDA